MMKHFSAIFGLLAVLVCPWQGFARTLEIPSIMGPIYPIDQTGIDLSQYTKKKPGDFVHPGIWHTQDDLETIRNNVLAKKDPWYSTYQNFSQDSHSLSSYTIKGPKAILSRGITSNYSTFTSDSRAAWQNALMWYITKDDAHWDVATTILDAWGSNLTNIVGIDRSLLIGLEGSLFVNAAEIMRWEGNWTETGASWKGGSGFSNQLYWLFSRQSVVVGQANYGMVSIKSMLDFAVYLDDVVLYNYAINEFINNQCAGIYAMFDEKTGQSVESGRDQSHTMSGIAWTGYAARTIQSQGADVYKLGGSYPRLLLASEYTAKFNQNGTVSYDPSFYRCEAVLVGGPWANISTNKFGITASTPVWGVVYYEYVGRRNFSAPWTTKAMRAPGYYEGNASTSDDHPSWGGLIWA